MARLTQGKIIILAFIFVFLGGYVCLYELPGGEKDEENGKVKKILDFNPGSVNEIEIVSTRDGKTLLFKKEGGQWRIKKPMRAEPDPERIYALLSIFDYGYIEIIDDSPSHLSQYGLVNPEIELTIAFKEEDGNSRQRTFLLGSSNPTFNACYCQVKGDPKIYLVGTLYKYDLEKDVSFYVKP
jgi:hypothetical protein